jgi:aldehyde dehydrogenase (NAD+)
MTIIDEAPAATGGDALDPSALVTRLRAAHRRGLTRPLAWRRAQLGALRRLLTEREPELLAALASDLGKPAIEGWLTELRHVTNEIDHMLGHLGRWAAPERVPIRAAMQPARASIVPEPLGVALVIAPWNYPLHLLLLPMAYALAAGNAVVGKPSELAPAAAVARLVPEYLDREAVAIVEGDAPVVTALLAEQWDHIFYTGNGRIGRIVMEAAAQHLTPVTLELGGKSPAIVSRDADIEVAARRIVWGKFLNAGQTCVAPDYVLVDRSVETALVDAMVRAVRASYGDDPSRSPDYPRIVNERHFDRLTGLLGQGGGTCAVGGGSDRSQRYIAPTILTGVTWSDPVMGEEIFGPILPVLAVDDVDAAIEVVNDREKPLALYVFSEDKTTTDRVVAGTTSGGVCVNGTLLQLAVTDLPFGGVGASGMGAYHGKAGFDAFSHRKAVLVRSTRLDPPVMYPPYTRVKQWLLRHAF